MVAVVVGEEDPADVLGLDDGEHLLQPLLPVHRSAGVDDHGLGAADDHGVHRHVEPGLAGGEVRDEVGLGGDRLDGGLGDGVGSMATTMNQRPAARYPAFSGCWRRRNPLFRGVSPAPEMAYRASHDNGGGAGEADGRRGRTDLCEMRRALTRCSKALAGELQRAVPYDAAAWFGIDPVTLLASAPSRVENLDAQLCSMYWHLEFHEQDFANFVDLAHGDGVSALRLSLDDRPARSIRYREFMAPQGFEDELRAVLRVGDSIWGFIDFYRESATQPFGAEDVALIKSVTSIIASSLRKHVRAIEPVAGPADGPRPAGDRSARPRCVEQRRSEGLAARPLALLGNRLRAGRVPRPRRPPRRRHGGPDAALRARRPGAGVRRRSRARPGSPAAARLAVGAGSSSTHPRSAGRVNPTAGRWPSSSKRPRAPRSRRSSSRPTP